MRMPPASLHSCTAWYSGCAGRAARRSHAGTKSCQAMERASSPAKRRAIGGRLGIGSDQADDSGETAASEIGREQPLQLCHFGAPAARLVFQLIAADAA